MKGEKVELIYVNPYNKYCQGVRAQIGELSGRRGTVLLYEACQMFCSTECSMQDIRGEEVQLSNQFYPGIHDSRIWHKAAERVLVIGGTRVKPKDLIVRQERGK